MEKDIIPPHRHSDYDDKNDHHQHHLHDDIRLAWAFDHLVNVSLLAILLLYMLYKMIVINDYYPDDDDKN